MREDELRLTFVHMDLNEDGYVGFNEFLVHFGNNLNEFGMLHAKVS